MSEPTQAKPETGSAGSKGSNPTLERLIAGLPEEAANRVREVYRGMLADYTRSKQKLAEKERQYEQERAELAKRVEEAERLARYYEQIVAPYLENQGSAQAQAYGQAYTPTQTSYVPENYDPYNPESVSELVRRHLAEYHNWVTRAAQDLWRSILELQAYNVQAMKLLAKNPDVDLAKVAQLAPQYGYDLMKAYQAVYESPKVWEEAKNAEELRKQLEETQRRLKELEARSYPGMLGGTVASGQVPRGGKPKSTQPPRTYLEAVSDVNPEDLFTPAPSQATPAPGSGQTQTP